MALLWFYPETLFTSLLLATLYILRVMFTFDLNTEGLNHY